MDLQEPERKMSTTGGTEAGTVLVLDEPGAIRKKFGSAVTDSGREVVRCAREARGHQPDRHPRRRPRDRPGRDRGRVRGCRLRRLQEGGRRGGGRAAGPGPERYAELRPDEAALEAGPRRRGREGARDRRPGPRRRARAHGLRLHLIPQIAGPDQATAAPLRVRGRRCLGPRLVVGRSGRRRPRLISTSTSSPGRSTC